MLEQTFLRVLPFQLHQLFRGHLTPVRRQRPVHLPPDRQQRLFIRVSRQSRRKLFLQHSHPPFQILQIQSPRRVQKRQSFLQLPRRILKSPRQAPRCRSSTSARSWVCTTAAQFPRRRAQPLRVSLQIFPQFLPRKWLRSPPRRWHRRTAARGSLRRFRRCIQHSIHAVSQTLQLPPARRPPRTPPTLKRPINPLKHRLDRHPRLLPSLQNCPIERRHQKMRPALPPEILLNLRKIIKVVKRFHNRQDATRWHNPYGVRRRVYPEARRAAAFLPRGMPRGPNKTISKSSNNAATGRLRTIERRHHFPRAAGAFFCAPS